MDPHPEERAPKSGLPDFGNQWCRNRQQPISRVSKDGRESMPCNHPSRRRLRRLLWMRSNKRITRCRRMSPMATHATFAEIAALAGDPGRAGMLHALMDGRALTASELARVAGIAPQTASGHLSRMTAIGLVRVERQGRHRYHRPPTPAVAHMLESIMQVASDLEPSRKRFTVGPRDAALRKARTCYDHLAGRLGVALADALVTQGHAEFTGDAGIVTDTGVKFFGRIGIDVDTIPPPRTNGVGRVPCPPS